MILAHQIYRSYSRKPYMASHLLQRTHGFSLIEVSIVLVIMGLMMGGLLSTFTSSKKSANHSDTRQELAIIEQALYGFAQANGRLPCPAKASSNGKESCPTIGGIGFVPSATLGIRGSVDSNNLLVDSWGNPYRYIITLNNSNAYTTNGAMRSVGMNTLAPDLTICSVSTCKSSEVITDVAVAVILSLGENWANFSSVNEVANSGETTVKNKGITYRMPNNKSFVSTTYSDELFDDHITWISPNILYSKMITAGQLP